MGQRGKVSHWIKRVGASRAHTAPTRATLWAASVLLTLTANTGLAQVNNGADSQVGDVVYDIDPKHTFPTFEVKHLGISTHRGRFNKTTGKVVLNPEAKTGRVDILIDTSTVDTGDSKLEEILRAEDFFHVEKFKTATFVSNHVEFNAQGQPTLARGDLTLRGVTRPVTVNIGEMKCTTFMAVRYVCGADMTATIKRSEFGMTIWRLWVSDDVKLVIQVEAVRQQAHRQNTRD